MTTKNRDIMEKRKEKEFFLCCICCWDEIRNKYEVIINPKYNH